MRLIVPFLFYNFISICFGTRISEQKCREYAEAVYSEENSPILMRASQRNRISQCGITSVPLIIGGTRATEKEFPHMAVIGFGNPYEEMHWDCGGSLISELYVLTAGHCLENRQYGPAMKVRLGVLNLKSFDADMQERMVQRRIPHPDYVAADKYNDIGLIQLQTPVEFTPYVRPACLNTGRYPSKVIASGFGKTDFDAPFGSSDLMKVTLTVYSNPECEDFFLNTLKNGIKTSMICAGEMSGGKDTCQGDSGGPLQIVLSDPYCMYSIVGVTSFGKFCGYAKSPALYTKVSAYLNWIEPIVWAN